MRGPMEVRRRHPAAMESDKRPPRHPLGRLTQQPGEFQRTRTAGDVLHGSAVAQGCSPTERSNLTTPLLWSTTHQRRETQDRRKRRVRLALLARSSAPCARADTLTSREDCTPTVGASANTPTVGAS